MRELREAKQIELFGSWKRMERREPLSWPSLAAVPIDPTDLVPEPAHMENRRMLVKAVQRAVGKCSLRIIISRFLSCVQIYYVLGECD